MVTTKTKNDIQIFGIPEDVFELLWFIDGPFKNIDKIKKDGHVKHFSASYNEPSAISIHLEIDNYIDNGSLWYWPSYSGLNSGQRLRYLLWLCDVTKPIDFGYVFLFHYGLERHLLFGKFNEAFKMINKLRKWHKLVGYLEYSQNALILASIIKDKMEMIDNIEGLFLNRFLELLYIFGDMEISADSIIRNAKRVGWKNDRYIKKNYEIFREILKSEMGQAYKISVGDIGASSNTSISFANYTLPATMFPDIFRNEKIKKELYNLLSKTHNIFKTRHRGEF